VHKLSEIIQRQQQALLGRQVLAHITLSQGVQQRGLRKSNCSLGNDIAGQDVAPAKHGVRVM